MMRTSWCQYLRECSHFLLSLKPITILSLVTTCCLFVSSGQVITIILNQPYLYAFSIECQSHNKPFKWSISSQYFFSCVQTSYNVILPPSNILFYPYLPLVPIFCIFILVYKINRFHQCILFITSKKWKIWKLSTQFCLFNYLIWWLSVWQLGQMTAKLISIVSDHEMTITRICYIEITDFLFCLYCY